MTTEVRIGFIPLVDAAPLVVAHETGIAERHGLSLALHKSASWAALRDRLSVGMDHAAHMLAPIPIASQVGLGNPKAPMIVPCGLSMNGNAISVSRALYDALQGAGWDPSSLRNPLASAQALAKVVGARAAAGEPPLTFASVYPFSSHAYELRYWMAAAGIRPGTDVHLTTVPPPQMVTAVREGQIDGFCVGAPWNTLGIASGESFPIVMKVDLWAEGPEKVLAVREGWADAYPETVHQLVRMLVDAAHWCHDLANADQLAQILSDESYLGIAPDLIRPTLAGTALGAGIGPVENYLLFDPDKALYPWRSHAMWFYAQMVRWGQLEHSETNALRAKKAYRPDIYRAARALADEGATGSGPVAAHAAPQADLTLFDGARFDPDDIEGYLDALAIREAP
ncbi:MAG: ABC transporter substrate-binding protein [Devosiaceae bacterium]|nr:ABC transporter substrate-binding protein [Devosiaceae bacterium MH13]